uniref:SWI2/SNF2 ATPase domain-containing protein n=1 Tax=Candidatus Nitrotoga fabula TaxID=2182327 RepID=A0A2X0SIS3_9PROT|nr:protein of unknown function [Candidatus Nitrotoga fabula]
MGYQIHAVKAIVECIHQNCGNSYIWHTTDSGKTLAPMDLSWKARTQKELALMDELTPLLHKLAQGREISGLAACGEGR